MNRYIPLFLLTATIMMPLYAWKGTEANGDQVIYSGVLTSQEGNVFDVTNITVGYSDSFQDKVLLYEMPKDLNKTTQDHVIPVNPTEELTTAQLELMKIKKIEVPHPRILWTWKDPERATSFAREFIEVVITWKSGGAIHYLLELGPEDTKRPLKVFGDAIDKPMRGIRQNGTLFCVNVNKADLRKKGAPFPSIKSLVLDEPCFKLPTNNKKSTNNTN